MIDDEQETPPEGVMGWGKKCLGPGCCRYVGRELLPQ